MLTALVISEPLESASFGSPWMTLRSGSNTMRYLLSAQVKRSGTPLRASKPARANQPDREEFSRVDDELIITDRKRHVTVRQGDEQHLRNRTLNPRRSALKREQSWNRNAFDKRWSLHRIQPSLVCVHRNGPLSPTPLFSPPA